MWLDVQNFIWLSLPCPTFCWAAPLLRCPTPVPASQGADLEMESRKGRYPQTGGSAAKCRHEVRERKRCLWARRRRQLNRSSHLSTRISHTCSFTEGPANRNRFGPLNRSGRRKHNRFLSVWFQGYVGTVDHRGFVSFKKFNMKCHKQPIFKGTPQIYDLPLFLLFFNTLKNIKPFFSLKSRWDRRNDTSEPLLFVQHYNKGQFAEEQGVRENTFNPKVYILILKLHPCPLEALPFSAPLVP